MACRLTLTVAGLSGCVPLAADLVSSLGSRSGGDHQAGDRRALLRVDIASASAVCQAPLWRHGVHCASKSFLFIALTMGSPAPHFLGSQMKLCFSCYWKIQNLEYEKRIAVPYKASSNDNTSHHGNVQFWGIRAL